MYDLGVTTVWARNGMFRGLRQWPGLPELVEPR